MTIIPYVFGYAFLALAVSSQSVGVGIPAEGESLAPGSSVVVQVQRPNSLTGSQEVGVAIGLASCASAQCRPPTDVMGTILYAGPFKPEYHEYTGPPYQNYTVVIPESMEKGDAHLNIAHFSLVGAGPFPFFETLNRTVIIA
ncbi:uncharacterized protein ACLA_053140 [Aspergillus clavatus NRRL 1]|uniref:Uncharacterized protein n=1 Tax=Aspergillus clavatus (strain ATCC 1007 / CBS 513.65 / DSM 816 / NCTC 3887 / NRRL 1 / QM 1276 / 107) TaxID=344612 RepID=A1CIY5_ASPCL|nr:uncharacterized protein ACLA_053140 [Aspergillus clavatus NRRL 1]EAW10840.1 conserved hypothetical protein [Aspergillus clavatus NRRL 1]